MKAPRRSLVIGLALVAAVVAAMLVASLTARSPEPSVVISPTPTGPLAPAASATALVSPSPSPSSPADAALPGAERFAVVVQKGCSPPGAPPYVRREDRSELIAPLGNGYLCQLNGAVSLDGSRLAYWHFESAGSSEIALYQNGTSTTLVRLGDELLGNVVWSAEGSGLLYVAMKGGVQGVAPEYAALRTLDLATGAIRELTRVSGRYLSALAWDRARRVTAAAETSASGGPGASRLLRALMDREERPAESAVVLRRAALQHGHRAGRAFPKLQLVQRAGQLRERESERAGAVRILLPVHRYRTGG